MINAKIEKNVYIAEVVSHFSSDDMHEILQGAEGAGVSGVLLNLEHLDLLSSSVIGMIVAIFKNLREIQIRLGIVGLNEDHKKLLTMTNLDRFLELFDSTVQAVTAWTEG